MTEYVYQPFPAWFWGPNGEVEIFQTEEDVPAGWVDHPSKVGEAVVETEAPKRGRPRKAVATTEEVEGAEPDEPEAPVEPSEF